MFKATLLSLAIAGSLFAAASVPAVAASIDSCSIAKQLADGTSARDGGKNYYITQYENCLSR